MKPTVTLSVSGKGMGPILNSLQKLERSQVYVGIPEAKATRKKSKINNAQLMYIHTNGSPIRGIPARPVIEPAIKAHGNVEPITEEMKQAAAAALDGKSSQVKQHLRRAGLTGQNAAKAWFVDPRNHWAPNAPSTIKRKKSDKPLIDTAQMRNAIIFVVGEE